MRLICGAVTLCVLLFIFGCSSTRNGGDMPTGRVSVDELLDWDLYGDGAIVDAEPGTVLLSEDENSQGVMIVGPDTYGGDVVLSYRVRPVNDASVLVALLSLSDPGMTDDLTVPEDYDGAIELLTNEKENYFFAFHNEAHNATPFIRKHTGEPGGIFLLTEFGRHLMKADVWYKVEVGRTDEFLWMKVDGRRILMVEDTEPLSGGRVAIRIRGTEDIPASCFLREVEVRSAE